MNWIRDQPIAHRGLHSASIPENSLRSFRAAIEVGYGVELDVRLTADGVPIVYHDADLARLTDRTDAVADVAYDRIANLRIGDSTESIPRLEDALDAIDGGEPVLIDLKNNGRPGPLESAVIDRLDAYDGAFAVQSFDPRALSVIRKRRPSWLRGQLSCFYERTDALRRYQEAVLKRLLLNWHSRPDFVAYDHQRLPYWPVSVHRALGVPILAWTVRNEAELRRVEPHADNVIFEGIRP